MLGSAYTMLFYAFGKQVLAAGEANGPELTHAVFIIKGKIILLPNYNKCITDSCTISLYSAVCFSNGLQPDQALAR